MMTAQLSPQRAAELEAVKKDLNDFINSDSAERLGYLWSRWQDEKEYEDFAEYEKVMVTILSERGTQLEFVKGTKRPFGFQCKHPNTPNRIFAITTSARSISWKAVK